MRRLNTSDSMSSDSAASGGGAPRTQVHHRLDDVLGDAEASEVALAVDDRHGRVREPVDDVLAVPERHDVVVVAVPPPHRDTDVGGLEAPVPGEQDEVVDR